MRVLARMERVGVGVDAVELRRLNDRLVAECADLTGQIQADAGHDFNVNSTLQLRTVLFDELGLTPTKKTKTGFSTDASSLEKLRGEHPDRRAPAAATARSRSSGRPTARACSPRSTRPTVASTPRSTRPSRAPAGSAPTRRTCTTSRSGPTRVARSGGRSCRPPATSCWSPTTTRSSCAASPTWPTIPGSSARSTAATTSTPPPRRGCSAWRPTTVTHEQRAKAKMVSYGLAYGMEAYGLAQRLSIEVPEAAEILDAYFVAFPSVQRLHGAHRGRGPRARLHRDAVRPPPAHPRAGVVELPHPPGGRAPGHERRHPGPRRRHLQGGARARSTTRSRSRAWRAGSSSRSTTR